MTLSKLARRRVLVAFIGAAIVGTAVVGTAWIVRSRQNDAAARDRALFAARRANIVELIPADLNHDGVLDVIAGYAANWDERPGPGRSIIEGIDGRTGAVVWTQQLSYELDRRPGKGERRFAVGKDHVALTWSESSRAVVSVHELATGRQVWHKRLPLSVAHWGEVPFRVWLHHELLLVLTDARVDRYVAPDHVLTALQLATGEQRWSIPIYPVGSAPWFLNGQIVVMSKGQSPERATDRSKLEPPGLVFIDPASGATQMTPLPTLGDPPIVADRQIWFTCHVHDEVCRTAVDSSLEQRCARSEQACNERERQLLHRGWLAKVEARTVVAAKLASGTPQPLGTGRYGMLAIYKDSIVYVETSVHGRLPFGRLQQIRLGEDRERWSYDPDGDIIASDRIEPWGGMAAHAPEAAYLHLIPARYLPLFVSKRGKGQLVVLDLETGTPSWTSKPFERDQFLGFTVRDAHYYFNLPAADDVLLALNGHTGTFDGAYQIEIAGNMYSPNSPNALAGWGAPLPWHVYAGRLVGHWRGVHKWIIDLNTSTLQMSSPGVRLLTPWDAVERVLGPMPRSTAR